MVHMQFPQWLPKFNRRFLNPVQLLWAGRAPSFGVVEHVGRKSGRAYRTPVQMFDTDEGVAILLTYGPDRDWLKNLKAADGGQVTRHGKTFAVADPRVMPKEQAAPHVLGVGGKVFPRLPFEQAVLLRRAAG